MILPKPIVTEIRPDLAKAIKLIARHGPLFVDDLARLMEQPTTDQAHSLRLANALLDELAALDIIYMKVMDPWHTRGPWPNVNETLGYSLTIKGIATLTYIRQLERIQQGDSNADNV